MGVAYVPFLPSIAPGIKRESKRVLVSGFQSLSVKLGFWILIREIPDSTRKHFPDSCSYMTNRHAKRRTPLSELETTVKTFYRN